MGGQIEFAEVMDHTSLFTRCLIRFPSDGLNIYYGYSDLRNDEKIRPVILTLHGQIILTGS